MGSGCWTQALEQRARALWYRSEIIFVRATVLACLFLLIEGSPSRALLRAAGAQTAQQKTKIRQLIGRALMERVAEQAGVQHVANCDGPTCTACR